MESTPKSKIDEINTLFRDLSYEEKSKVFSANFASGFMMSGSLNDKLKLINLVCLCVAKLKEDQKSMNSKVFLSTITHLDLDNVENNDPGYRQFAFFCLGLAILCDDFLYFVTEIDHMGYSDSDEIIKEILRLINQWMPF